MKRSRYLKHSLLPPRLRILDWFVWWVVLDYFHAPGWVYGVLYTLLFAVCLGEIVRFFTGEEIEL